jgi:serine protease Do
MALALKSRREHGFPQQEETDMTRALAVALPLLAAVACAPQAEQADAPPAAIQRPVPEEGFRTVVAEVLPAIVFIQAEAPPVPELEGLLPPGHPLADQPAAVGIGSGVLYTDDGYILTNNHVVQDAERVLVVLHDRRLLEARVVGRDPSTEVAVVKVEGSGFPAARLGDSDHVGLGDWVLAMGSPLGLQFSVTAGIVSGLGRDIGILRRHATANGGTAPLEHFIQTDAALSPGNSGGPLLNGAGEVIGINTAVAAAPGAPSGHGFAIPSNLARRIADQLVNGGVVQRSYLGVVLRDVSPELAQSQGLERVAGAAVERLEADGPADRAGVRGGDVVVGIQDHPVVTVSDLQARLAQIEPGSTVALQLLRGGRGVEVSVELGVVRSGHNGQPSRTPAP